MTAIAPALRPPARLPRHAAPGRTALALALALLAGCRAGPGAPPGDLPGRDDPAPADAPSPGDNPPSDGPGLPDAAPPTPAGCRDPGLPSATSPCLAPRLDPAWYVAESLRYFDTLDVDAPPDSVPRYSPLVARWEWPPWLKLTGFGRDQMESISALLRQFDPSTVPFRDCRAFPVQPFGRCRVSFDYGGRPCPIYEEFTFNDAGETTFIEAWSDLPGLRPMADDDPWAEAPGVPRLSTRVPGLGTPGGLLDPEAPWMAAAAASDPDLADFLGRATDFWQTWYDEWQAAGEDLYARGCGWPASPASP